MLLLAGFLVPLLLVINFGRNNETALSTLVVLGVTAVAGGSLFVLRELLAAFPAVHLHLFRIPAFCMVCSAAFFNNAGLFGAQFMIPIFLQQVMGFTPLQAGLLIVPAIITSGLSGALTGRLSDMVHPALVTLGASVVLVGVFYTFSTVTPLTAAGVLVVYITCYRICLFATNTPLVALNARILGSERIRMGHGLMDVTRNIGSALGVTMSSVVFERRRVAHQLLGYAQYDDVSPAHADLLRNVTHTLPQAGMVGNTADQAALRSIQRHIDIEATAAGFRDSFLFIGLCFLFSSSNYLSVPLSFFKPPVPRPCPRETAESPS